MSKWKVKITTVEVIISTFQAVNVENTKEQKNAIARS